MMKRIATVTLLGICVGCCVALLAVLFVDAVAWLNDTLFISPRSRMLVGDEPWLILVTLAVPTLGGLTVGLLCRAIPEQRPHGPPDAILGAHSIDGRLPVKGGIITAIAACL
jgi:CIC family chloride channel protein